MAGLSVTGFTGGSCLSTSSANAATHSAAVHGPGMDLEADVRNRHSDRWPTLQTEEAVFGSVSRATQRGSPSAPLSAPQAPPSPAPARSRQGPLRARRCVGSSCRALLLRAHGRVASKCSRVTCRRSNTRRRCCVVPTSCCTDRPRARCASFRSRGAGVAEGRMKVVLAALVVLAPVVALLGQLSRRLVFASPGRDERAAKSRSVSRGRLLER